MQTKNIQDVVAEIKSLIPKEGSETKLTDWWEFDRRVGKILTQLVEEVEAGEQKKRCLS